MSVVSDLLAMFKRLLNQCQELFKSIIQDRRIFLIIAALVVVVCICILTLSIAMSSRLKTSTVSDSFSVAEIPQEEIFTMDEPDFLPPILLQREPQPWTVENILPFWTDPLENGELEWRERIRSSVDILLQEVP
jgi:hypothetical protein